MIINVLFRAEMRARSPLCRQRQPFLGLARPIDKNKDKKHVDKGAIVEHVDRCITWPVISCLELYLGTR
jgi:hypothetical protein